MEGLTITITEDNKICRIMDGDIKNKRYRDEYWLGEYYDEIINNENNNFMFEVCERFISDYIYVLQDFQTIRVKDDEILDIIENQEIMKSIIYK